MNLRRTALPLLTAFLVSGCVALPHPSAPPAPTVPEPGPPALAPAAQRPPRVLPEPSKRPVEAEPREELAETEGKAPKSAPVPAPVRPRARQGGGAGATGAGAAGTGAAGAGVAPTRLPEPRAKAPRAAKKPSPPRTRTAAPAPTRVPAPRVAAPRAARPAGGEVPEMRDLCREAQRIEAPMGAAELCRSLYGR
ncbi:hypothetical protein [Streptomyces sp. CC208A]|uniref:hypothetical protein n=1 Tax=Streptomyces sp. CC208A TaxID=3044573 RepID=UPI0024A976DE|nr:hypothetical protein [Streptomyces sp. CC208A]